MSVEAVETKTSRAVDWELEPQLSCILCTFPRTGSSLLSYGLQDTGLAGRPTEYFSPTGEAKYARKWGLEAHYSLSSYLKSVANETMSDNGVLSVKIFMPYLSRLLRRAQEELGPELSVSELLGKCFPNPRYIFLRRGDLVRQAVSFMRAINTFQFESRNPQPDDEKVPDAVLKADPARITAYIETFRKQEREWREFFEQNNINAHEVVYEDLASDYGPTVFRALGALGITPPPELVLPQPRLARQSDEATELIIAKYREDQCGAETNSAADIVRQGENRSV